MLPIISMLSLLWLLVTNRYADFLNCFIYQCLLLFWSSLSPHEVPMSNLIFSQITAFQCSSSFIFAETCCLTFIIPSTSMWNRKYTILSYALFWEKLDSGFQKMLLNNDLLYGSQIRIFSVSVTIKMRTLASKLTIPHLKNSDKKLISNFIYANIKLKKIRYGKMYNIQNNSPTI